MFYLIPEKVHGTNRLVPPDTHNVEISVWHGPPLKHHKLAAISSEAKIWETLTTNRGFNSSRN